jgi:uncharacterized delta-60 repeat protein
LDSSFDGDGRVTTNFGGDDRAFAIVRQANGKIVIAGTSAAQSTHDVALARYQVNGSLDATFDGDGKAMTDFGGSDYAAALALQADGKLVMTGFSRRLGFDDVVLARYGSAGSNTGHRLYLPAILNGSQR